jgi:hypothetical protein
MKFIAYCLLSWLLLADFAAAQNRSLGYSTYVAMPGQISIFSSALLGVDNTGSACTLDLHSGVLVKLDPDGALIYAKSTTALHGNAFPGPFAAVATDSGGNCYVAGLGTITPTPGVFQSAPKSEQFVMKFDSAGNVIYATYLGGCCGDDPSGLAVDAAGNAYLIGTTDSPDFPTKNAYQPAFGGGTSDAFVAVLNPTATALVYSTYLGGTQQDFGAAIAVDSTANAYITGTTHSANFPTVAAFQSAFAGTNDAYVTKLNSSGTPIFSTFLSGSGGSSGSGIAADGLGDAYVTGAADSSDFPVVKPIQSNWQNSAFVSEFNPAGSALVYSTFFGSFTSTNAIAADSSGQTYIAGQLAGSAPSVPTVSPIESSLDSGFISVLGSAGASIVFSTYISGPVSSVAVDSGGNIYGSGGGVPSLILNSENGIFSPFTCQYPQYNCIPIPASQGFALKIAPTAGPALAMPTAVVFLPTVVGAPSETASVLLANASSAGTVNISNIASSADFSQTNNCPSALAAATSCLVNVTLTPTAGGLRTGMLTITDDQLGSPQVIQLSGNGLTSQDSLMPSTLTFPPQDVGTTSSPQVVTLTNTGTGTQTTAPLPVDITQISISGSDFAQTNNCGSSLPPSTACGIHITFTPTMAGTRTGTLSITDNAAGSPQTVPLSGIGVGPNDFVVAPASGSQTSQTVSAGKAATFNLAITPGASFSGTVNLTCNISPVVTPAPTCSLPGSVNVTAGTAAPFTVMVSTTAPMTTGTISYQYPGFPQGWHAVPWSVLLFAAGVLGMLNRRRRPVLGASIIVLAFVSLVGCGGGNSSSHTTPGTPAGTYTATVTATSGSLNHNMTSTVIVQ